MDELNELFVASATAISFLNWSMDEKHFRQFCAYFKSKQKTATSQQQRSHSTDFNVLQSHYRYFNVCTFFGLVISILSLFWSTVDTREKRPHSKTHSQFSLCINFHPRNMFLLQTKEKQVKNVKFRPLAKFKVPNKTFRSDNIWIGEMRRKSVLSMIPSNIFGRQESRRHE